MIKLPLFLSWLFAVVFADAPVDERPADVASAPRAEDIYLQCGLADQLARDIFTEAFEKAGHYGVDARILAVADMTQPSTSKRLYIIDLQARKLLKRTYVAHGQGSGESIATAFSNTDGSHQTSLGLYRVGEEIVSPKHGAALLLYGMEKGVNCQALSRQIIMHGADYVSDSFIKEHGRLGRSWGCPAVSRQDMPEMISLLRNTGVLYIHG